MAHALLILCTVLVKSFAHLNGNFFLAFLEEIGKLWKGWAVYSEVLQFKNWFFHTPLCSELAPLSQGGQRKSIALNVRNFWPALYNACTVDQDIFASWNFREFGPIGNCMYCRPRFFCVMKFSCIWPHRQFTQGVFFSAYRQISADFPRIFDPPEISTKQRESRPICRGCAFYKHQKLPQNGQNSRFQPRKFTARIHHVTRRKFKTSKVVDNHAVQL